MSAVAVYAGLLVPGAIALADQHRRPESEWAAADRARGWWIPVTWTLTLLGLGLFAAVAYAVGVVPRFGQVSAADAAFRRGAAPPPPAAPPLAPPPPPPAPAPVAPPAARTDGRIVLGADDV